VKSDQKISKKKKKKKKRMKTAKGKKKVSGSRESRIVGGQRLRTV